MKDLRNDYNVKTTIPKTKKPIINNFNLRKLIRYFTILFSVLIITKPSLVGHYLGGWFNRLYTSFEKEISIPKEEWYVVLVTVAMIFVIFKLTRFDFNRVYNKKSK